MNILFLNHQQKQCGVYQYGKRTYDILKKSTTFNVLYSEVESLDEYLAVVKSTNFSGIIYNYHNLTMQWLGRGMINPNIKHYGIHHEGTLPTHIGFNYYLHANSTFRDTNNQFALPRPLFDGVSGGISEGKVPIISSFGFGFGHKNFGQIVRLVNDQFDKAIIKFVMPRAYYGDIDGSATAGVLPGCWNEMDNPNVTMEIIHDFLTDEQLLKFLSESDLNVFLYMETGNVGLSSAIDYSLSVNTPIAVNTTSMFRHIALPEICVENHTLPEIMERGSGILDPFRQRWSHVNFIKRYEYLLNNTL